MKTTWLCEKKNHLKYVSQGPVDNKSSLAHVAALYWIGKVIQACFTPKKY